MKHMKLIDLDNNIKPSDAIELRRELPDNPVDLLLRDIPYARVNKTSNGLRVLEKKEANRETFDLQSFAHEAFRVTKRNAIIFSGKEQVSSVKSFSDLLKSVKNS